MEPFTEHTISFVGLKDGQHEFHFELGPEFFAATGEEELEGGHVAVYVKLDKSPNLIVANIQEDGTVALRCARCNGPLAFRLQCDQRQIFRISDEEQSDDDELVTVGTSAHSINLTHYIYECLRLALPIRPVHPAGECDPDVVSVLEEGTVTDGGADIDPRWEALKELKKKRP